MNDLPLTKIAETSTTITLGWTPPAGAVGYYFFADGVRVSNSTKADQSSTRFKKVASGKYAVQALGVQAEGKYPPAPVAGVPKHTYDVTVVPAPPGSPEGGHAALWMGWYQYRQRTFDRLVNDEFYGAMMFQPSANWPVGPNAGETWLNFSGAPGEFYGGDSRAYQGKWGRVWNFHNADNELGGAGWDYNPGWSANAMDFINGNLTWNLDDNPVNNYMVVPWSQMQLGHRYTIAMHCVMGRKDGEGGTRPGVLEVWADGVKKIDLHNVNTIWKFTDPQPSIQRYYWMWAGFYTGDMHPGYSVNFKAAYPFTGPTIAAMKAESAGGEGEDGVGGGFSHFSPGSTATLLAPWSSSDLVLPAGW
jgi:hypothetical protein